MHNTNTTGAYAEFLNTGPELILMLFRHSNKTV